jgi:hypothetical protein
MDSAAILGQRETLVQNCGTETVGSNFTLNDVDSGFLRWEEDMYEPLADFLRRRGMVVLREVKTYQGRIDLVGIRLDSNSCWNRQELGFTEPITSLSLLKIYTALPERISDDSVRALAVKLAILPSTLKKSLRELRELGAISPDGYRLARIPRIVSEIVCCEAKLTAWQAGVRQAYAHRFYAHKSFIALNHVSRNFDASILERRKIGLLSVRGGVATCEQDAPSAAPSDEVTYLQLQELAWAKYLSSH